MKTTTKTRKYDKINATGIKKKKRKQNKTRKYDKDKQCE